MVKLFFSWLARNNHVSGKALKEIHSTTHPGAFLEPPARATEQPAGPPLSSLAAQSEDS